MKKRLLVIILLVFLIINTSCKAISKSEGPSNNMSSSESSDGYDQKGISNDNKNTQTNESNLQRKIIKNGSLNLIADNVDQAYDNILTYAKTLGGYEFKHQKSKNNIYTVITAQIKISPEGLDLLMNYAGTAAEVLNSKTTSDDITSNYYDTQIRLDTQKKSLAQYYTFLQSAKTIDETLRIQNEINKLTTEIESLEGKIKLWDTLISESTLDLSINQKNDPLKPKKDIEWNALTISDMGTLIKNGFMSVVNVLVAILQWLAIIVLSISPILIIAGIVIFIVRHKRKLKKSKNNNQIDNKDNNPPLI